MHSSVEGRKKIHVEIVLVVAQLSKIHSTDFPLDATPLLSLPSFRVVIFPHSQYKAEKNSSVSSLPDFPHRLFAVQLPTLLLPRRMKGKKIERRFFHRDFPSCSSQSSERGRQSDGSGAMVRTCDDDVDVHRCQRRRVGVDDCKTILIAIFSQRAYNLITVKICRHYCESFSFVIIERISSLSQLRFLRFRWKFVLFLALQLMEINLTQ